MKKIIYLILLIFFFSSYAQNKPLKNIKIYYDCQTNCYESFIKQNLSGVEFVRDMNFADVHIQLTSETNGSGGETYHIEFIGKNKYQKLHKQYSFSTNKDMTQEIIRKKLLKYLKIGLFTFWIKNGMDEQIEVKFNKEKQKDDADIWNNWIFKIGVNGWFNGDYNGKSQNLNGFLSIKQIKEKHKFYFKFRYGSYYQSYKFGTQTIKSNKEWLSLNTNEILSINNHWSYGFFGKYLRSKYSNHKHSYLLSTGLEYDIFPYKDNAKKSWVFSTKIGGGYNKYFEKTIYNKRNETVFEFNISTSNSFVMKWGNIYSFVGYSTYLHNLKFNSFDFGVGSDIRIAKGLKFNIHGNYTISHNQINIAAGNLSLEEILLAQKQLQSGYDYYLSVGLSYSFGSIYNTIVNPRFNSEGGGRTCICF